MSLLIRCSIAMAFFFGIACTALGNTVERTWLHYSEIADLLEKFESIPPDQRRGLNFRLRLDPSAPLSSNAIRLWIQDGENRVRIPINGDDVLTLPRLAAYRESDPLLLIQVPEGVRVGLAVEVTIDLPERGTRSYADWMRMVKQAADGLRKQAGFWALFMPKAVGLDLRFANGESATAIVDGQGVSRQWKADAKGRLIVPMESDLMASDLPLKLTPPPLLAMPYLKAAISLMPSGEAEIK